MEKYLMFVILSYRFSDVRCNVPDPCPDIQPITKVADMCSDNNAIEETVNGNPRTDSVVLRVMSHTGNCICHVTVEHQNYPTVLYVKKYNNLVSAAPENENCGLQVNISYQEKGNTSSTGYSMSCTKRQEQNIVTLIKNGILTLTSDVINGNFTRGYCIEIARDSSTNQNLALRTVCVQPGFTPSTLLPPPTRSTRPTTTTKTTVTTTTSTPRNHQSTLTAETSDHDGHQTTDSTFGHNPLSSDPEESSIVFIAVGAGAGVFFILTIIILAVFCKRKQSKTKRQRQKKEIKINDNAINVDDPDYDGLKYNVMYASSEQQEKLEVDYSTVDSDISVPTLREGDYSIVDDGHYSMTSDERTNSQKPPIIHPKPSTRNTGSGRIDTDSSDGSVITSTNNSNVYAVVNKTKIKNATDITTDIYAVVDKSRRNILNHGNDKTG